MHDKTISKKINTSDTTLPSVKGVLSKGRILIFSTNAQYTLNLMLNSQCYTLSETWNSNGMQKVEKMHDESTYAD